MSEEEPRQTWISPRRDAENARTMGEGMAEQYEEALGRKLAPDELAVVHEQAREVTASWGAHARRVADREKQLGRALTPGELAEEARRPARGHDEEPGEAP